MEATSTTPNATVGMQEEGNPSRLPTSRGPLSEAEVREIAARALSPLRLGDKRVLLIAPDSTRTAPVGLLFRTIHDLIAAQTRQLDVLVALGTHPPMSDEAINRRLEITAAERADVYRR